MTYKEEGFRPFYHQFCAIELTPELKEQALQGYPDYEQAKFVLVYGYIDRDKGLMLEVLAGCKKGTKYFHFFDTNPEVRSIIAIETVEEAEAYWFDDEDGGMKKRYAEKIDPLDAYRAPDDIEETRTFEFLDPLRDATCPDDINVILYKKEFQPEACWVRITGLGDHCFQGTLLNEPNQDYPCHAGDTITFFATKGKDDTVFCVSDFNEEESDENENDHEEAAGTPSPAIPAAEYFTNEDGDFEIAVASCDVFAFALFQNDIQPVRGIRVLNRSGDIMKDLTLRITSDYHFFRLYERPLPGIPAGKPVKLPDPKLMIHGNMLAELTEEVHTLVTVEVCRHGHTVAGFRKMMRVLAYDQYPGPLYVNYLPAFIMPNHPLIPPLLHDAGTILQNWGKEPAIEGYQSNDPNRVKELAAAAYAAIQRKNILYATAPANLWTPGQRIRTPEFMMETRLGNCMEMTCLYAAVLEAMGLHAILYLISGHIFCGVWLTADGSFDGEVVVQDNSKVLKRMNRGSEELLLVESTAMCTGKDVDFDDAVYLSDDPHLRKDIFDSAIDVASARFSGVKPMASRVSTSGIYSVETEELKTEDLSSAPSPLDVSISEAAQGPAKILTKQGLWESKLLDLSRHNMLLSLPYSSAVEPILSTNLGELEDALADGEEFHLQAIPDWITGYHREEKDKNGKKKIILWIIEMLETRGIFEMTDWRVGNVDLSDKLRQEYKSHRLYTYFSEKDLNKHLSAMYRAAKASQQENGVSSLYLVLGLLRWFESDDTEHEKPGYAPLILMPVEIIRKSANQGYALHMRDEEPHFNLTLLEMLRQFYGLEIGGLDPLPTDEHGIDLKKVFATVRKAVYSIPSWDVVETCAIGNFSFAQFAMWNDLHTGGDMLENNKVVRSLMKGHIDWELNTAPAQNKNLYLPITLDGTQLEAVTKADTGNTFVLHGPPGTGKSQTITAMIANLLANRKKVLFVAEKMAALTVVQRRLEAMGIGDFCLELHSDKANKKHVLTQLDQALQDRFKYHETGFRNSQARADKKKSQLNQYGEHLHEVHPFGFSLRELIDRYETVEDVTDPIVFDADTTAGFSSETIKEQVPLLKQLIAAGNAVDGLTTTAIGQVGLTEYSFTLRYQLKESIGKYRIAIAELIKAGELAAENLGGTKPTAKQEYTDLEEAAKNTLLLKAACEEKEKELLTICKPELFTADKGSLLEKYNTAKNKFIGKNAAILKVTQEIQKYFNNAIQFEQIPELLNIIDEYRENQAKFPYPAESKVYTDCDTYIKTYQSFCEQEQQFNEMLARSTAGNGEALTRETEFCDFILQNAASVKDKALYNKTREECLAAGLKPAVEAYEANPERSDLIAAYRKGLYYALIYHIMSHDEFLSAFSGATFDEAIRQFKAADDELMSYSKQEIYDLLAANVPGPGDTPAVAMQINLLRKAISSNARGMSIRELFDRIPDILFRLAPCMLMSPNSVAQYLTQKNDLFDVVIFDEASQLPTCKAIGALARAKDAVIVGDPKQMPPTTFFAGSGPAVDDLALDDLDSILDDALALGIPSLHLQWHYRSRHESLIAFSNYQFYENKMYTFPSANDREQHVVAIHVDGLYKKSVNAKEAEAVVAEIYRRFLDPELNKQSIGVVTFNVKQQDLIYNLLARQYQNDPGFDTWANSGDDPLFIKNLENVQGDERDVILFSIGYGKDEKGRLSMNFGPINKPGGGKRLNVAFSRARIAMVIFTSLYSSDIKVTTTSPDGLVAFRDFLKFAEGHALAEDTDTHGDSEDTAGGIITSICRILKENGYSCETMIGHSDFRIDIAVINPYEPDKYLFGILLDGDTYRNTKNTRDREIAQSDVLKNLGWKLHRIWTIDWWDNKTKQISRLLSFAEKEKNAALAAYDAKQAKAAEEEAAKTQLAQEAERLKKDLEKQAEAVLDEEDEDESPTAANDLPPAEAEKAEIAPPAEPESKTDETDEGPSEESLEEPAISEEKSAEKETVTARTAPAERFDYTYLINDYVPAELTVTPLDPKDYISSANRGEIQQRAKLIMEKEAPIQKDLLMKKLLSSFSVNRTTTSLEATEKALKAIKVKNLKYKGVVFCWEQETDPALYNVIRVSNERSADDICPQELRNAACYVLQKSGEMDKTALIREMSRVLGYKRVGKNLEAALTNGLAYAKNIGAITINRGTVSLAEDGK